MFTLKVLSGQLYGADIPLPPEDIFFVVGNAALDTTEHGAAPLAQGENTLYIPLAEPSPNFLLRLASASNAGPQERDPVSPQAHEPQPTDVRVTCFAQDGTREQTLALNQPVQLGALWLALKRADEVWSAQVDAHLSGGAGGLTNVIETLPDASANQGHRKGLRRITRRIALPLGIAVAAATVALAVPASNLLLHSAPGADANLLREVLAGAAASVLSGRDGKQYVLVEREPVDTWTRRLRRHGVGLSGIVLRTREHEVDHVSGALERAGIAFGIVRFDKPAHPMVMLDGRASDKDIARTRRVVIEALPYAQRVEVRRIANARVIEQAEHALRVAGIDYDLTRHSGGASIRIAGALDDRQLERIDTTIQRFQALWGDRIVQFHVRLAERPASGIVKRASAGVVRYARNHVGFGAR